MPSDFPARDIDPGASSPVTRANNWTIVLSIVVSAVLFFILYRTLDRGAVWDVIWLANAWLLTASIGAIVPITLLIAFRFYRASPPDSLPGYQEAVRLTLVASAFNLFLPSKAGDLVKSFFIARRGNVSAGVAFSIIVYERLCDFLGLITWCLVAWLISPSGARPIPGSALMVLAAIGIVCLVLIASKRSAAWLLVALHRLFPSRRFRWLRDLAAGWPALHEAIRGRRRWVVLLTLLLWLAHLTQMWMFTVAVSAIVPYTSGIALFALAVLAGQVPFTFGGLGARDVALVVLLSGYMPAEVAAAIGLLSATRGILPALAALPVMRPYLAVVSGEATRWGQAIARTRESR